MRIDTTTWEDVNSELDIFLEDVIDEDNEEDEYEYAAPQRIAAWNWGQRLLALHTPRQIKADVVVDTDSRSAILPPDFLAIWRIYDSDRERVMRQMQNLRKGAVRYSDDELGQYWVWSKHLYFEKEVSTGDLTLYYWAYWPEVEYETVGSEYRILTNEIYVPQWTLLPLCHITAAICLQPGAIQAARIRQWNIEVDSGNPIQNSRATQAREHLWWWREILSTVPSTNWREGLLNG